MKKKLACNDTISFRISGSEKKQINDLCNKLNINYSDFYRRSVKNHYKKLNSKHKNKHSTPENKDKDD